MRAIPLLFAMLVVSCCERDELQPVLREEPPAAGPTVPAGVRPGARPPPVAEPVGPDAGPAGDAGTPVVAERRVRLTWAIRPLRRLRRFVYRNDVVLVVHLDRPVRIRIPGLEACGEVQLDPETATWLHPVPGVVQILNCYTAGGGDYVVVARAPLPSTGGERYVVKSFSLAEGDDGPPPPFERLRTRGSFTAPRGASFEAVVEWPWGRGVEMSD